MTTSKQLELDSPHYQRDLPPLPKLVVGEKAGTYRIDRSVTCEELLHLAKQALKAKLRKGTKISHPRDASAYLQAHLMDLEYEVFGLVCLDTQHRVISNVVLFRGTIDSASVHPREVVKHVFDHNASAVILYHNHPSGNLQPSDGDIRITRRLKEALDLIEVRVLDHCIVSYEGVTSLSEIGQM